VIPLVIEQLLVYVSHTARKGLVFSAFNVALAGMALLAIAYSGKDLVTSNRDRSASFKYENYLLAQEINRKFPDKPLIAMGDRTGSFAYWYNGNVLQMEGVIGNYELAEAIKRNDLAEYLTKYGVQALLHWCYEYDPYHPQYYGDSHNFFTKIWNPKMDFAPAENYAEWDLVTPWPFLSMGPYARLRLYKEDELLRFRHKNGLVYLWKWRGSEPRPKRNER
jgi:hypothetical protein